MLGDSQSATSVAKRLKCEENNKIIIQIHYLLCFCCSLAFILHIIDMYFFDLFEGKTSSFMLLTISSIYAILGGFFQLEDNKKKLKQYITGILIVISLTLTALFFKKDILIITGLLGFVLGFYDFRLTINRKS